MVGSFVRVKRVSIEAIATDGTELRNVRRVENDRRWFVAFSDGIDLVF